MEESDVSIWSGPPGPEEILSLKTRVFFSSRDKEVKVEVMRIGEKIELTLQILVLYLQEIGRQRIAFISSAAIDIINFYAEMAFGVPLTASEQRQMENWVEELFSEIGRREDLRGMEETHVLLGLSLGMASSMLPPKFMKRQPSLEAFEDLGLNGVEWISEDGLLLMTLQVGK